MPNYEQVRFNQFDQVRLSTTRNVKYLSAPPGTKVSPHGLWSVVAVVANELLLANHNVIIRIPAADVLKMVAYDLQAITAPLGKLTHGQK